jgi:hypothetical protein
MAQSLARLWTHLIFSTKDRHPFLSDLTIRNDAWSDAISKFHWHSGYGAFSVSQSHVLVVQRYIAGQEQHTGGRHLKMNFVHF